MAFIPARAEQASPCRDLSKDIELTDFQALGLSQVLLKAVAAQGYDAPTPIQKDAIPHILKGEDIMGLAQTGTGKTAAFGLPLVHRILDDKVTPTPTSTRALILAPTRELVNQISRSLVSYLSATHLKVTTVTGGVSIGPQIKRLSRGTDILVATPGRLIDLLDREAIHLDKVAYLVLDEADQMLDLGFIHALRRIASLLPSKRQTLLFSATMPKQIEDLARSYLRNPVRVEVAPAGRTADRVTQCVHFIGKADKINLLTKCLKERDDDVSLVFTRTKHGADKVVRKLVQSGIDARAIHGNKSQNQRDKALKAFSEGSVRVLIATDVAARGIDIPGVSHVYNFDLPEVPETYVHRIGRTARAGADGDAIAFCCDEEVQLLRSIEKLTGLSVPIASGVVPSAAEQAAAGAERKRRASQPKTGRRPQGQGHGGHAGQGNPRGNGKAGVSGKAASSHSASTRGKSEGHGEGAKPAAANRRRNTQRRRNRSAASAGGAR